MAQNGTGSYVICIAYTPPGHLGSQGMSKIGTLALTSLCTGWRRSWAHICFLIAFRLHEENNMKSRGTYTFCSIRAVYPVYRFHSYMCLPIFSLTSTSLTPAYFVFSTVEWYVKSVLINAIITYCSKFAGADQLEAVISVNFSLRCRFILGSTHRAHNFRMHNFSCTNVCRHCPASIYMARVWKAYRTVVLRSGITMS